jgi:hypothetical protein
MSKSKPATPAKPKPEPSKSDTLPGVGGPFPAMPPA